jgi:hypothetical protein
VSDQEVQRPSIDEWKMRASLLKVGIQDVYLVLRVSEPSEDRLMKQVTVKLDSLPVPTAQLVCCKGKAQMGLDLCSWAGSSH